MRNIKIEFHHDRFHDIFTMPGADVERDFTAVTAKVVRDSRDQPNRRIARMKALEKAITPLPRAQRIEVWNAWNNRTRPRPATSATPGSGSSPSISESTLKPATTIRAHIWNALTAD